MITGKYYRIVGANLKNFLRKGESRKRGKSERRKGKGESGKWKVESGKGVQELDCWLVG
jgi:hypothetical protein